MEDNSIINNQNQTDAIMIDNHLGTNSNITITNNLFSGGDYTVYVDGSIILAIRSRMLISPTMISARNLWLLVFKPRQPEQRKLSGHHFGQR